MRNFRGCPWKRSCVMPASCRRPRASRFSLPTAGRSTTRCGRSTIRPCIRSSASTPRPSIIFRRRPPPTAITAPVPAAGRKSGEVIRGPAAGLRMLLALEREGSPLIPGRPVQGQQAGRRGPLPGDRAAERRRPLPTSPARRRIKAVLWPYRADWDHNAGSSTRSVTLIRVEPLPPGTTDIACRGNWLELYRRGQDRHLRRDRRSEVTRPRKPRSRGSPHS